MTDQTGQLDPEPLPIPTPAPLPVAGGSGSGGKRKVWPWIVGVVLLLVLIGGCVGAVWVLDDAINSLGEELFGEGGFDPEGAFGPAAAEAVAWADNGRYGVVQYLRDYTYPSVAVWDSTTGETRKLDGYRVLFVEPAAAVVWLEPVTDEEADMGESFDGFGDVLDHAPGRLLAWNLDDGSNPTDNVPSKWHAWPGPGDSVVYLEINPLKGAGPSAMLFNNKASSGEGVKAAVPTVMSTFVPVGWSPSGRYFAVEGLVDEALDGESDTEQVRKLVIFDAETGEASGIHDIGGNSAWRAPLAAWDGAVDTIYLARIIMSEESGDGDVELRSATATGLASVDAFKENGWDTPREFREAYDLALLGWDPEGPLYSVGGRIWQITAEGLKDRGYSESMFGGGAWHPQSGMLGIEYGYNDGPVTQEWVELVRTDIHGGNRESLWEGPKTDISDQGF